MITKYIDFINENNSNNGITTKELELLKKYNIKNYSFNEETGLIDVDSDVNLSSKNLITLPCIRFGTINGNFNCTYNKLTSLIYSPITVNGYFACRNNFLTSLQYCPSTINGNFSLSENQLTSLQYCPSTINGDFNCNHNELTSLQYCPTTVNGYFYCLDNKFTGIENYPLSIIKEKITDIWHYPKILKIVNNNLDRYIPFIENGDRIRFHQQIMRDDPSMITYYKNSTIPLPKKSSII